MTPFTWRFCGGIFRKVVNITIFHLTPNPLTIMPKKKASKTAKSAATKKASVKKGVAKKAVKGVKPVGAKDVVGYRLRMDPGTHKQLVKMAAQKGVSQNTMINLLIHDAK